jgi:hypothetical protein
MALSALDGRGDGTDGSGIASGTGGTRRVSCGKSPLRLSDAEAATEAEERARTQRDYSRKFWLETFDLGVPWVEEDADVHGAAQPTSSPHSGWSELPPERASPLVASCSAAIRPLITQPTSPERAHGRSRAGGEGGPAAAVLRTGVPCEPQRMTCSGPVRTSDAMAGLSYGSSQRPAVADATSASKLAGGQRSHASVTSGGGSGDDTLGVSYLGSPLPAGSGVQHRLPSPVSSGRGRSKIDLFSSFTYAQAARESAWGPATISDFSAERHPPDAPALFARCRLLVTFFNVVGSVLVTFPTRQAGERLEPVVPHSVILTIRHATGRGAALPELLVSGAHPKAGHERIGDGPERIRALAAAQLDTASFEAAFAPFGVRERPTKTPTPAAVRL